MPGEGAVIAVRPAVCEGHGHSGDPLVARERGARRGAVTEAGRTPATSVTASAGRHGVDNRIVSIHTEEHRRTGRTGHVRQERPLPSVLMPPHLSDHPAERVAGAAGHRSVWRSEETRMEEYRCD